MGRTEPTKHAWTRPTLDRLGTLKDVAGQGGLADQSSGNPQDVGNSKS